MRDGCPFCDYDGPSEVLKKGTVSTYDAWGNRITFDYFVIEPLDPVTPGHLLVVPYEHEPDFRQDKWMLGAAMVAAARVAADLGADEIVERRGAGEKIPIFTGCNLIVSSGAAATQTVDHVHVHVIPRREGDGLCLPWS